MVGGSKCDLLGSAGARTVAERSAAPFLAVGDTSGQTIHDPAWTRIARSVGLNVVDFQTYGVLLRSAEPMTPGQVSRATELPSSTTTRVLDRLEAKKLVERGRCESDRRQVLCTITTAGLDLLREADPVVRQIESRSLGRLSDVNTRQLIRLLDAVREGHS